MLVDFCHYTFHASLVGDSDEFSSSVGLLILVDLGGNSVHVGSSLLGESFTNDEVFTIFIFIGDLSNEGSSL